MPEATPPRGTPLSDFYTEMTARVGTSTSRSLGQVDAVTIGRFALTIGATDPVHVDADAACAAGYAGVVAPPNLLAAMYEWGVGTPQSELNVDGTPRANRAYGLRGMGAGEEMEFCHPATAGMDIVCDEILESVAAKNTQSGLCVFVTTQLVFRTPDGLVLNRNRRTVVRRNPHEEAR